ncbi:MAG: AgmX/PglI C-terminal domain-containing protein [Candidatus Binatia bacterium]
MSKSPSSREFASRRKRLPVAIAITLASLGLIAIAFAMARKSETSQPNYATEEKPESKSSAPWNLALGNVVVLAPELGLKTSAPDKAEIEPARIAAKIEAQLLSLRQLYREQSEGDPALLGALTLQLTLGSAGQVAEVTVLSAQMKDKEFRKAVVAEATKWNFNEIASEGTVIDCPLLFVREGMDIATVLNWEKTLRNLRDEHAPAKPIPQARVAKKK